jgi:hypothetical protein
MGFSGIPINNPSINIRFSMVIPEGVKWENKNIINIENGPQILTHALKTYSTGNSIWVKIGSNYYPIASYHQGTLDFPSPTKGSVRLFIDIWISNFDFQPKMLTQTGNMYPDIPMWFGFRTFNNDGSPCNTNCDNNNLYPYSKTQTNLNNAFPIQKWGPLVTIGEGTGTLPFTIFDLEITSHIGGIPAQNSFGTTFTLPAIDAVSVDYGSESYIILKHKKSNIIYNKILASTGSRCSDNPLGDSIIQCNQNGRFGRNGNRFTFKTIGCENLPNLPDYPLNWETANKSNDYNPLCLPPNYVSIRNDDTGKYCADDADNYFRCNRNSVGPWEKFIYQKGSDGKYSFKGLRSGKWCQQDSNDSNKMKCVANNVGGEWEKFTFLD